MNPTASHVFKAATAAEGPATADGGIKFLISTEHPDLVGDIVVQSGMKAARNPLPAQIDHGGGMFDMIGAWKDLVIEVRGGTPATVATLELLPPGISRAADLVRAIHAAGIKLAASIGFRPTEYEPIKGKPDKDGYARTTGYKFLKSVLIEASVVVTPANPRALQVAKSMGYEIAPPLPAPAGATWHERERVLLRAKAAADAAQRVLPSR
jgi:hypothetical protein